MSNEKLELLFDLAEELYAEELKKSGLSVLPYSWARKGGNLLAISCFGKYSTEIENKLKEII